jgi:hypothetical protein
MGLKIFSDLITMLERLAKDVAAIEKLPEKERKKAFRVIDETFRLLDQAILLMATRLGDVLLEARRQSKVELAYELQRLGNDREWLQIERDVRLCNSLREASVEWRRLLNRLGQRLVLRDHKNFGVLVGDILEGERTLADFISASLKRLSRMGETSLESAAERKKALGAVEDVRDALLAERHRLIEAQVASHGLV